MSVDKVALGAGTLSISLSCLIRSAEVKTCSGFCNSVDSIVIEGTAKGPSWTTVVALCYGDLISYLCCS